MNVRPSSFLAVLVFFLVTSCEKDEPAVLSDVPSLREPTLSYVRNLNRPKNGTLTVSFILTDSDFDIGLGQAELDSPYHLHTYHVENGTSFRTILPKIHFNANLGVSIFDFGSTTPLERLVTSKTRENPVFNHLPDFTACSYVRQPMLIRYDDAHLFDEGSMTPHAIDNNFAEVFDWFYCERNENHFNLFIQFFVETQAGVFEGFDAQQEFCLTFDKRIPPITSDFTGAFGPFEFISLGERTMAIIYQMHSFNFTGMLTNKRVKLRVTMKDRALNKSNTIETNVVTIE